MFEREAVMNPDHVAVVFENQRLSYAELNARANQLARYLARQGIRPEVLVALFMTPSLEAAISALAILKAGGVSVFLPVDHPDELLKELIGDSGVRTIVTSGSLANRIAISHAGSVCVDAIAARLAVESRDNLNSDVRPENAAYIRFTSGSTGKPKGVINIHRSLTARFGTGPLPDVQRRDVCSLNAGQGLTLRLLTPLALGATVVILRNEEAKNATQLVYALEKNSVTSIYIVPSLLRQVLALRSDMLCRLRRLRAVTVGGEVLTPDIVDRFLQALPDALLLNVYGSNETGGTATMRSINSRNSGNSRCIGRPVANTKVYILDESLRHVRVGETGEICVASDHLARGYLNRPDLTVRTFLRDPFRNGPDARLYRTGDLGRYLPDGEIEFIGRADRQVKIRGFRVELDEIEVVLLKAPDVREAAVIAERRDSGQRVIGYVAGRPGKRPRQSDLRRFLADRLPRHMLPATLVVLAELPQTSTGKVDRKALPPPEAIRPDVDTPYEAPRTPLEALLADMWASVLQLDRVGVNDNFLELGGDSLAAAQVISHILDRFEIEVSLTSLFESPTIACLAQQIDLQTESESPLQMNVRGGNE